MNIDMNTKLRHEGKKLRERLFQVDEKCIFFGKTMENMGKHLNIKVIVK